MSDTESGVPAERTAQAHSDFESPDPSQFLSLLKGDFLVILGEGDEHCACRIVDSILGATETEIVISRVPWAFV
jgi:hypothetical protein